MSKSVAAWACLILIEVVSIAFAARAAFAAESELLKLASAKFPNLTKCERAVLLSADVKTTAHGNAVACGPSATLEDPSNNPANAATWDHQRDLRAELIRWVFVAPDAIKLVDPFGIEALGARITGSLDLGFVHAPVVFGCVRCSIPEPISLQGAELNILVLSGSYTNSIFGGSSHIHNGVFLDDGFKASGQVSFGNSRIDSDFDCRGGSFHHSKQESDPRFAYEKPALFLGAARVEGPIFLSSGFKADGGVDINGVTCIALMCTGSHFRNPGSVALNATGIVDSGFAVLSGSGTGNDTEAEGMIQFDSAKIGGYFIAVGLQLLGQPDQAHGLSARGMSVSQAFVWKNVLLQNGATLDLRGTSVNGLVDEESSWPQVGRLAIEGFQYGVIYSGPIDSRSRLRWIGLDSDPRPPWLADVPAGFRPGPYRVLAHVLRDSGDEAGVRTVLIAQEDVRYRSQGPLERLWGLVLKWTIGYGHQPMRAIGWSFAVVMLGWIVVSLGARAGVMTPTFPENRPPNYDKPYEQLHPFLYSLDVFLPFVNLHQEHYWWPDATRSGTAKAFSFELTCNGSLLRYYLWAQIIAGWLLSAIFVAGVTGLVRND